jgi:polysaccharide pyruvyl transferase WcaK-like protein
MSSPTKKLSIRSFFMGAAFKRPLVIGYYGGGNYGDELLMEVMMHNLQRINVKGYFYYQGISKYRAHHKSYEHELLGRYSRRATMAAFFKCDSIVIGGGGIWGMDFNKRVFELSVFLLLAKCIFRKQVYLVGVGAYASTSKAGRIATIIAGMGATEIYSRDRETYGRFFKWCRKTHLSEDLIYATVDIPENGYKAEISRLTSTLTFKEHAVMMMIRRFNDSRDDQYRAAIKDVIGLHGDTPFFIGICESRKTDPIGYSYLLSLKEQYPHVVTFDFSFNPIAFFFYIKNHADNLLIVAPQYHMLLTAFLNNVEFMPISYDNKSFEFLSSINRDGIRPQDLTLKVLQGFLVSNRY